MNTADAAAPTPAHLEQLAQAVLLLERPGLAARLAEQAGKPLNRIIRFLPHSANDRLQAAVKLAIMNCLKLAIGSMNLQVPAPAAGSTWLPKIMTGLTGGLGGMLGLAALPFELPLTTTLMFRSIAEIARGEGEDLEQMETRLACLEVFALGDRRSAGAGGNGIGYYAARTVLARLTNDAAAYLLVDRGALEVSSPVLTRLLGEIASRFGFVVSERVAAGAVPVVSALGGATVNVIFMEHFQRIARGHFMVRRLEREYGAAAIRRLYDEMASGLASGPAQLLRPERRALPGPE
jgi:hypothetical protein